jgi:hypothetical protein
MQTIVASTNTKVGLLLNLPHIELKENGMSESEARRDTLLAYALSARVNR